jgi:membrane dipeptidase
MLARFALAWELRAVHSGKYGVIIMKRIFSLSLAIFLAVGLLGCQRETTAPQQVDLEQKAKELAEKFIIVDTHIDVPYRLNENWEDISQRTERGDFDYPRAKAGGLNVPFMSIYTPAEYAGAEATEFAKKEIEMVDKFASDWPDKFAIATSVADVKAQFAQGKISLAMGMENGSPIGDTLDNVTDFYERGIRYITLTHSKANQISDSSYDPERKWNGLSDFGKEVVVAMNVVGIMVDVSHVSDDAFYQVMDLSRAPVIASHSSCRYFTPGWERNMDDAMIQKLAQNGGVIQIAFGSSFLDDEFRKASDEVMNTMMTKNIALDSDEGRALIQKFKEEKGIDYADVTDVAAHIDHVVQLVGVDHVGFGSDFDGVGDTLPYGLKDVSGYPNLIRALLEKGYSDEDIEKICGGNLLRVWSEVERVAQELQTEE